MENNEDKLLTVLETAKYLRLSKETIYRMVKSGTIPFFRIGRKLLFWKSALDNWFKTEVEK